MKHLILSFFIVLFTLPSLSGQTVPDGAFGLIGTWMVDGEDGQGFIVDYNQRINSQDDVFAAWFTFDRAGLPLWLIAAGPVNGELTLLKVNDPNIHFRARLAEAKKDIVGTARLTLNSCRSATFAWTANQSVNIDSFGTIALTKLTPDLQDDGQKYCNSPTFNSNQPEQEGKVCFFKDDQYQGESFCMQPGEIIFNLDDKNNWDNTIASMRVTGRLEVQLFTEPLTFGGPSIVLRRSISNFANTAVMPIPGFHRSISAIKVIRQKAVCFYDDYNFQGLEFCISPNMAVADLSKWGLRGQIRSMKLESPGTKVHLGFHENFKGRTEILSESVSDFSSFRGGVFDGQIQSIYVDPF